MLQAVNKHKNVIQCPVRLFYACELESLIKILVLSDHKPESLIVAHGHITAEADPGEPATNTSCEIEEYRGSCPSLSVCAMEPQHGIHMSRLTETQNSKPSYGPFVATLRNPNRAPVRSEPASSWPVSKEDIGSPCTWQRQP